MTHTLCLIPGLLLWPLLLLGCQKRSADADAMDLAPASTVPLASQTRGSNLGPNRLRCGPNTACDARTTYCEAVLSDAPELPSDFTCRPLPKTCAAQKTKETFGCDCLPETTRCRHFCVVVDTGEVKGLRLTCVGGA